MYMKLLIKPGNVMYETMVENVHGTIYKDGKRA